MSDVRLPEGYEIVCVTPLMYKAIEDVAVIAYRLRPRNKLGQPLTYRDRKCGVLVSDYSAQDYKIISIRHKHFYAVRRKNTGRIVAFRWLYAPDEPIDRRDIGTKLIRKLFGAVFVGKQLGVSPHFAGFGFGSALVQHTTESLKADVFNVVLNSNKASVEFHKKRGYLPMHRFTLKGYNRTIYVKRYARIN